MSVTAIIACAGSGARAGLNKNKLLYECNGTTVIERTVNAFLDSGLVEQIIVTTSKNDVEVVKGIVKDKATVVLGGATRTLSIKNALPFVDGEVVLIHDGARPFVSKALIQNCIDCTLKNGSAVPTIHTRNTMLKANGNVVQEYLGKDELFSVQTPQGFITDKIKQAYEMASGTVYNDDGEVYKDFIGDLYTYEGDPKNVKLTYPEDFELLNEKPTHRFGTGFDCHKLVENRKLILGGVEIQHEKGLLGHSDADVLTHAIMDAILSALSLRDIGYHFSDKSPEFKDACSMDLLARVLYMIDEKGYKVQSVSATIMAEKPKLMPHIPTITESLAKALNLPTSLVGIGATTLEGLGFVGREEGICAQATAVLVKK